MEQKKSHEEIVRSLINVLSFDIIDKFFRGINVLCFSIQKSSRPKFFDLLFVFY